MQVCHLHNQSFMAGITWITSSCVCSSIPVKGSHTIICHNEVCFVVLLVNHQSCCVMAPFISPLDPAWTLLAGSLGMVHKPGWAWLSCFNVVSTKEIQLSLFATATLCCGLVSSQDFPVASGQTGPSVKQESIPVCLTLPWHREFMAPLQCHVKDFAWLQCCCNSSKRHFALSILFHIHL